MLVAALILAAAAPARLPPVEQCVGDPEFNRVRRQLERVVETRDFDGLLQLTSDDVRVSFGGVRGRESFSDYWTAAAEDRELLWDELRSALRLGCAQAKDGEGKPYRAIPAMFVTGDDLDGFATWSRCPVPFCAVSRNASSPARCACRPGPC